MNILNELKNKKISSNLLNKINEKSHIKMSIMEVCGTQTNTILKSGIKGLLPKNIKLINGPGCPVCVTPQSYIDMAIKLSKKDDIIITTFGDLMRVPGKDSNLSKEKAKGNDIRVSIGEILIGGQQGCSINMETETSDTTTKDSGVWSEAEAIGLSWSVDLDGLVVIGDEGLEALKAKFMGSEVNIYDEDTLSEATITIRNIRFLISEGTSKVFITATNGEQFKLIVDGGNEDKVAFLESGDSITIKYYDGDINIIKELY